VADAAELRDLLAAQGRSSVGADDVTLDEVVADLTGPRVDLERDGLVVLSEDQRIIAWGAAFDEHDERAYVEAYLQSDLDDDTFAAIAACLLAHACSRLQVLARTRGQASLEVTAGTYRDEHRLQQALVRSGFGHDRVYWRMAIDLDPGAPSRVALPDGVTVRRLDPEVEADFRLVHTIRTEAFARHHGMVAESFEHFRDRWLASAGFDPTAWWLALLDDEPMGILLGDDSRLDDGAGFVRTLGVRETARGRGIARALLHTAFAEYAGRGRTRVLLAVDAANESGAIALYESVGMRPVVVYDAWSLTLADGEGATTRSRKASTSA